MGYLGRTPTPSPVTADDIPDNSIHASKIIDGSIELAEIADNSITDAKLNSTKLDGIADSANNYSHPAAHTISEVTGLQGLLDGKTTETYVNTQVAALVDSSPATLDTLNELATALGNDPNFATTVTNSIGTKLPLAGGTMTGTIADFTSTGIDDNATSTELTITDNRITTGGNIQFGTGVSNNKNILAGNGVYSYIGQTNLGTENPEAASDYFFGINPRMGTDRTLVVESRTADGAGAIVFKTGSGAYSTGAPERMRINSAGNVGIGHSNPYVKMVLAEDKNSMSYLDLRNDNTGSSAAVNFRAITIDSSGSGTSSLNMAKYKTGKASFNNSDSSGTIVFSTGGSERLVIANSGEVGIGDSSPESHYGESNQLVVRKNHNGNAQMSVTNSTSGSASICRYRMIGGTGNSYANWMLHDGGGNPYSSMDFGSAVNFMTFGLGGSERLRITSAGNVGIGTSSPAAPLHIYNSSGGNATSKATMLSEAVLKLQPNAGNSTNLLVAQVNSGSGIGLQVTNGPATADWDLALSPFGGKVGIGTATPVAPLNVVGSTSQTAEAFRLSSGANGTGCKLTFKTPDNSDLSKYIMQNQYWTEVGVHNNEGLRMRNTSGAVKFSVSGLAGNCVISGSLSKGSGSFKINHPLESKKDTHHLVHSFIEGPQADNIYRGKVDLVSGTKAVNIDTVAGMTEGTFGALNREVQCFTTNESGWTAIKGAVVGNILTIVAQDSACTDTISWMVIGERKDPHMLSSETDWTDSDGKVIVEPLKTREADQYAESVAYHKSTEENNL